MPDGEKWTTYFFIFFPQLILQFIEGGPMVLLQRKLYFSKDPEGVFYFPGGGGGGPCPTARKDNVFFFFFFFFSSTYFTVYRGGSNGFIQRKLYFSKDPEGV